MIGQKLLLAFAGKRLTPQMETAIREYAPAGLTLFRSLNVDSPAQLRELNAALQSIARAKGLPPLLIAADQEGGQLMAIGGECTPLPGNMALGAAGSETLAYQAGEVLGRELLAMGVNVNYAPVCDVNINPHNPVIGIRSFGENPDDVGRLASAMIRGIQSQGVAATAKHFPGHGDTASDSHHGLSSVPHAVDRLRRVEFLPFKHAIAGGVQMVMSAHLALPALDGPDAPPATLSQRILRGLLREELGFDGVIVTDAMDMKAIRQGEALGEDALRAVAAGVDLLLLTSDPTDQRRVFTSLQTAAQKGALDAEETKKSIDRILSLKRWLAGFPQPGLSVVGCADHLAVADAIAEKSITLVRDQHRLLPLRLQPEQRVAVVQFKPVDLTLADTSSYVTPGLAAALRSYHPAVDEWIVPMNPDEREITELLEQLRPYDVLVIGTLNAFASEGQSELVRQALKLALPTVVAALRLPYDLTAFPEAPVFVCTYGIQEPSMRALAKALFGTIKINGRLPVSIEGLYPVGWGMGENQAARS
ncbi:MAG: glycoside hydrolase family 3 protein [Chloroflexi bacterium]|nr:glycoside hydrolase family 3 protein [Chloroflexota bacterium]